MASGFTKPLVLGLLLVSVYFHHVLAQGDDNPDILANMNVDRGRITLSGFSSGGAFAQMMQFSYSSLFSGIAVFSHNYYRCGPPNGIVDDYDRVCTTLFNLTEREFYNPELVHRDIQDYERRGLIENTANLRNKRLYVYAGLRSDFFTIGQSLNILRVYERYINSPQAIFTRVQDANLVLPTDRTDIGGRCSESPGPIQNTSFFIGQCGLNGVEEALNHLLNDGLGQNDVILQQTSRFRSTLRTFDQREFTNGLRTHNMDTIGYYYVPRKCRGGTYSYQNRCLLHFYFHGCFPGREPVGRNHILNSGLLELADRRGIIMIFPQAVGSPLNPDGCWDTFGLGGSFYATQIGQQIIAVKRMLDRILGLTFPQPIHTSKFRPSSSIPNSADRSVPSRGGWNWKGPSRRGSRNVYF